jgi:signal transduction histidine kinase
MAQIAIISVLVLALVALSINLSIVYCRLNKVRKNDRMKRAFLNNVGREVRIPLKSVIEMADIVAKEDLYLSKNEKREIADQLQYNANLISTFINEVLVFTEADTDVRQVTEEQISPNAVCLRCMEANMHSIYHRQAVKLQFKRELSDEFFVKSDRHLVEIIINKLILNSCRFTEEGSITVGCNTSERVGQIVFFVEDTGGGIPENRVDNLFSWFDTPDDMNDEAELDLSICQRLAQKLGGALEYDTTYHSGGTRMLLILPLK